MSEEVSTTPESAVVAETPVVSAGKGEKAKIKMASTGGGFSFDEFNRAIGKETDNVDEPDEPEADLEVEDLRDETEYEEDQFGEKKVKKAAKDEDEDTEEAEDNEGDESESDEGDEGDADLKELSATTKKGAVKAFTKDGKELKLPPDLEIEQMVDGEPVKINLREHLNVVAGELTVNSRLGKISSFRDQVEKRRAEIEQEHSKFHGDLQTLVSFAAEGKPELAICYLAELNGMSPIQMKKSFLKSVIAEATKFEGKSEIEIENYYLNLENQWRTRKEKKAAEAKEKQDNANQFVQHVNDTLTEQNLTPDEFSAASEHLRQRGELEGLDRGAALKSVVEHALLVKHVSMVKTAIEAVNPKYLENKKLFSVLMDQTHPNKFTVAEIEAVLRDYLGVATNRIASSLSKKVQPSKVMARSEKQNEAGKKKRVFKSADDLRRAFNL